MHKEGTKMHISPDKTEFLVESPFYSPVKITYRPGQQCTVGYNDFSLGKEELIERACDGRMLETFLIDGNVMRTIK